MSPPEEIQRSVTARSGSGSEAHMVLLLPFTPDLLASPEPLLPLIYRTFTPSTESLSLYFSTPSSSDQRGSSSKQAQASTQLYTRLKQNPGANFTSFQSFLGKVYATLATAQWENDKVLSRVEVYFEGEVSLEDGQSSLSWHRDARTIKLKGYEDLHTTVTLPATLKVVDTPISHTLDPSSASSNGPSGLRISSSSAAGPPTVALGGTFDHFHAAHKLLIQSALFLCTRRLIVGIMSDSKLSSKSNADLIEPIDVRLRTVEEFLSKRGARASTDPPSTGTSAAIVAEGSGGADDDVKEGKKVRMEVVEISDPYGPTGSDPDIQALVVSQETVSGGKAVNRLRGEKGLSELEVFVVDVIASDAGALSAALKDYPTTSASIQGPQGAQGQSGVEGGDADRREEGLVDLKGVEDEKLLKDLKMGSTGIRQWIKDHP